MRCLEIKFREISMQIFVHSVYDFCLKGTLPTDLDIVNSFAVDMKPN